MNILVFFRHLFWAEYDNCRIKRCTLSSGNVSTIHPSNYRDCPRGLATDVSERRIYWFTPHFEKTLRSADYDGTNKVTHYVDPSGSVYARSLARVGKLLFWGGEDFCMKFHNLLSATTHNVPCVQNTVMAFAVYERGKCIVIIVLFICFPLVYRQRQVPLIPKCGQQNAIQ